MSNEFIVKFRDFDNVESCFDIVAVFGNNVERNFALSTKPKQIEQVEQVVAQSRPSPAASDSRSKKGKEEYLYSAFVYYVYLKALRHGSHSFTCKYTIPAFPSYAFTRWRHL